MTKETESTETPADTSDKKKDVVVIGYKAFNKDMKCRSFQYEIGKTYKLEGNKKMCESGFHFCENPMNVFNYYPAGSPVAEVEAKDVEGYRNEKSCASNIKIKAKLSLKDLIKAHFEFIRTPPKAEKGSTAGKYANSSTAGDSAHSSTAGDSAHSSTAGKYANSSTAGEYANSSTAGDCAHSSTAGEYANSSTAGDCANSSTAGDYANSSTAGKYSIAAAIGRNSMAKNILGGWIVLAEYELKEGRYIPLEVKTANIDGKALKADTWYKLEGGKFIAVKE